MGGETHDDIDQEALDEIAADQENEEGKEEYIPWEEKYELDENGRVPFELRKPVRIGDEIIPKLRLREPEAGDFERCNLENFGFSDLNRVVSKISGQPLAAIRKVKMMDMIRMQEVLSDFLPIGQETGVKK